MDGIIHRGAVALTLFALIAASIGLEAGAVALHPQLFTQPGAWLFVAEPALALTAYGALVAWAWKKEALYERAVLAAVVWLGVAAGLLEICNVLIEGGIPFAVQSPAVKLSLLLLPFALWAAAGLRATMVLRTLKAGVAAAAFTAGIAMLVGVTGGFLIELYLALPASASVAAWPEFQRSGWSDVRAFAVANTLDSGFSHLAAGPAVGAVLGGLAGIAAKLALNRRRA